ncbi:MAG: diguanylate cyclase [Deltaproteobacteria bacterium]|nr:diguanylate cyclase [Deltaproteobacteria bacterium]
MARGKTKKGPTALTPKEIEILRWVQEGKTNDEIGVIIGKSVWTSKYHLKSIMKKLNVTSRAQAVSQAIGMGMLPSPKPAVAEEFGPMMSVGIVGCGRGGTAVLNLFRENPSVKVEWTADRNPSAPGIIIAREAGIPTAEDYRFFLDRKVDVVINLTGSTKIAEDLRRSIPASTELMGGVSAKIMWQMFEERRKRAEEREKLLKEHEALYHLGLVVESIDSVNAAGYAIIDYATKLTDTPAGSIALFDEKREDMMLVASKGFSADFKKVARWNIRDGGLTHTVVNHEGPLFIPDMREFSKPNPVLLKEGVRTLLAAPLTMEGRIVGVLYVNDFKKRRFRAEDISLFSLLTIYAGLTMERVKALEETRLLSITDGLTGLYNQRFLMEQLQKEIQGAARHNYILSLIMLDIDSFKEYNDTFGHLEGNKILKSIARLLKKNTRMTDTVGRFGGEEFCIIMPQIKKEGAHAFGRRLIGEIEKYPMPNRTVTLSGGVATFPTDGKNHLSLLRKADARLYRAKREGRNRICS